MDFATWLNTIVGIIGIIVGIIGWKSLDTAIKIKNSVSANNGAKVQQAQIIHNGLEDYAVIKLAKETTKEDIEKILKTIDELKREIPRIEIKENEAGGSTLIINNGTSYIEEEHLAERLKNI